jgi:trimethylamine--corrinoid protein Co-methyltransferase
MKFAGNMISEKDIKNIHELSMRILAEVGVEIEDNDIVELFKQKGARTEGNVVFMDEDMVNKALQTVPSQFEIYGRKGNVTVGGDNKIIAPVSGPITVMEGDQTRQNTAEDFIKFQMLHQSSDIMDMLNPNLIEPSDISAEDVRDYQMAICLKYTDKPLIGFTTSPDASLSSIEMAQDFYGVGDEENVVLGIISVISPLKYDETMLDAVKIYAERNQPLMFACCSLPGATSPTTISGTMAVNNAEVLGGIVMSQIIKPGLPVIYGNTTGSCDLRFVSPAIGSVETGLIILASAELAKFYGIPCRTGGALSDAKDVDWQAGVESTITMLPSIMSTSNFILQSCGVMDSFNVISYEKFMLDEQNIKMFMRMKNGFALEDKDEVFETIKNVGVGGQYLQEMHTAMNFRKEHFNAKLFNKEGLEIWEKNGSKSVKEKAADAYKNRLAEHKYVENTDEQKQVLAQYLKDYMQNLPEKEEMTV